MKIVYSNDFLFHGQEEMPSVLHLELFSLLAVAISEGAGVEPVLITHCRNSAGECFSRSRFFALSGVTDPAPAYYLYDPQGISAESWAYFQSFFDRETVFVASEFGMDLREKLSELGITYVNFWFHPYKLLNDAFFLVGTNSKDLFTKLEKYRVSQARLRFYCRYYSQLAARRKMLDDLPIDDNCCVFAGQTYQDKSVSNGTKYLNITDYPEKVAELARQYSKIYYVPHPSAEANPDVDAFLSSTPGIEVLEGVPTYYLLASPKVKKVVALSSSVLYEAQFFGKETEYLFRPLFKIDEEYSLNTFVSVYQDYFAPEFWRDLLGAEGAVAQPNAEERNGGPLLARDAEMFRDLLGVSFGYRFLGRTERVEGRLSTIEDCLRAHSDAMARDEASLEALLKDYETCRSGLNRDLLVAQTRMQASVDSLKAEFYKVAGRANGSPGVAAPVAAGSSDGAVDIVSLRNEVAELRTRNDELSKQLGAVSNSLLIRFCIWLGKIRRKIIGL